MFAADESIKQKLDALRSKLSCSSWLETCEKINYTAKLQDSNFSVKATAEWQVISSKDGYGYGDNHIPNDDMDRPGCCICSYHTFCGPKGKCCGLSINLFRKHLTVISIIRERMYIYVPVPGGQTAPRDSCGDIFCKLYLPTLIDSKCMTFRLGVLSFGLFALVSSLATSYP